MTQIQSVYTVQEAARMTGLSTYTLRYYEREGLLAPVVRDRGSGHRRYSDEDLRLLRFLKRMRETGMSIQQMKHYVALILAGEETYEQRRQMLVAHRQQICMVIAKWEQHLLAIDDKIAHYESLTQAYAQDAACLRERKAQK